MPDRNDIDARKAGPEPTEAELLLIDLLYGELEGEAEAQARARIEGDESMARELETYGELRAMLRELPEEEPPQAVSARLVHVAAEAAPHKRATALALDEEPGMWTRILRFFQPLVSNPAVAAAAMLVLVAGVAGALYLGGKVEVAQPTAPGSPAPESAAPPAATAPEPESGESGRYQQGRGATLAEDEMNADLGIAKDQPPAAAPAEDPARAEPSTRSPAKRPAEKESSVERDKNAFGAKPSPEPTKPTVKPRPRSTDTTTAPGSDNARGSVSGQAGSGGLIDADDEAIVTEETKGEAPAQQAPAPPPEDQKKADKSRADAPATLHQRAILAAADGECDAVRALATQIRSADAGYYDKAIRTDKRLATCLTVNTKK